MQPGVGQLPPLSRSRVFLTPGKCLRALIFTLHSASPARWQALIGFLSMDLPILDTSGKKNHVTGGFSRPASFTRCNVSRPTQVVARTHTPCLDDRMAAQGLGVHPVSHSFVDGYGGSFHFLAAVMYAPVKPQPLPLL